jgi:hypothetical protein
VKVSVFLKQAAKYRDLAKRAARLATSALGEADRVRLLRHGRELEQQAAALEKQAAAVASPVTLSVGLEEPPAISDRAIDDPADFAEKPEH